jgi:hypothetical protein
MSWHDDLAAESRVAIAEILVDLAHDLGRYLAMQTNNLGPEASRDDLLECLRADLLQTRRSGAGVYDAAEIWAPYRERLQEIAEQDGFRQTFVGMSEIVAALPWVREGDLGEPEAQELARRTRQVASDFRRFGRQAKEVLRG